MTQKRKAKKNKTGVYAMGDSELQATYGHIGGRKDLLEIIEQRAAMIPHDELVGAFIGLVSMYPTSELWPVAAAVARLPAPYEPPLADEFGSGKIFHGNLRGREISPTDCAVDTKAQAVVSSIGLNETRQHGVKKTY